MEPSRPLLGISPLLACSSLRFVDSFIALSAFEILPELLARYHSLGLEPWGDFRVFRFHHITALALNLGVISEFVVSIISMPGLD